MSRHFRSGHAISGVFIFLLLGLFAVFSTVMVVLGARAYRNIAHAQELHATERIAPSYLRSMVRATDQAGTFSIEQAADSDMLLFRQDYDGEEYITYIYCHDGTLFECFISSELDFEPGDGEIICPLESMKLDLLDHLLHVSLNEGDNTTDFNIALYAET